MPFSFRSLFWSRPHDQLPTTSPRKAESSLNGPTTSSPSSPSFSSDRFASVTNQQPIEFYGRTNHQPHQCPPGAKSKKQQPEEDASSSQWQDINPPADYPYPMNTSTAITQSLQHQHVSANALPETQPIANTLPDYNQVSGAVVVDWNGRPRFLSPQEEAERQETLQRAVRERMLGLPRTAEFNWAPSDNTDALPRYSVKDKGMTVYT